MYGIPTEIKSIIFFLSIKIRLFLLLYKTAYYDLCKCCHRYINCCFLYETTNVFIYKVKYSGLVNSMLDVQIPSNFPATLITVVSPIMFYPPIKLKPDTTVYLLHE